MVIALCIFSAATCLPAFRLSSVAAQQAIDNFTAADAIYQDFPPKETLPPEELAVMLETWDVAAQSNDLRDMGEAIDAVDPSVPRP